VTARFTLSVDVEGLWGLFFVRSYVDDPSAARAGRVALPRMGAMLADREMAATFVFVGHLLLDSCGPWQGRPHPAAERPEYPWYDRDWYADDPGTDEARDPLWYARSQALAIAAQGHDVGAHGFAHVILDPTCVSRGVAADEMRLAQEAAKAAGLPTLRSFVFPQNVIGHVDALAEQGFTCYRDTDGGLPVRAGPPGGLGRAANLARHALAAPPHVGQARVRDDGVVVVPSSFPLLGREGLRRVVTRGARVARIEKGLAQAAREDAILHVWTHPHAFASPEAFADLADILDTVAAWVARGDARVLTMAGLADVERAHA
jgi:hypothetical protein